MFRLLLILATCTLPPSLADVLVQPGYVQAGYGQPTYNYIPVQPYPRSSLASEYQRYQDLNQLVQQQISGLMQQNTVGQMRTIPVHTTSYHPKPHILRPQVIGGKVYSLTPFGVKGLSINKYGLYNGHLLGSSDPTVYQQYAVPYGGRYQWVRSVQPDGANSWNASLPTSGDQNVDDMATQSAIIDNTATEVPQLETLGESKDKQVDSRATGPGGETIAAPAQYHAEFANQGTPVTTVNFNVDQSSSPITAGSYPSQIFDQIRPDFSHMSLYDSAAPSDLNNYVVGKSAEDIAEPDTERSAHHHRSPQSHPAYSESTQPSNNWLTAAYHNYMNRMRSFVHPGYGYPGYTPYPMGPMAPMYPMGHYGGMHPYGGGGTSSSAAASSSSSSNYPYGAYKTASDYVGKGLTYNPADWARYGQKWANQGAHAVGDYVHNVLRNTYQKHPGWFN